MKLDPARRQEIRDAASAFGLAVGVHLAAGLLLILGTMNWQAFRPPEPQPVFTLIDAGPIVEAIEEEREAEREAERQRQEELERQQREAERQRQEELERQRAEAERQRQQELERQREAERQRQAEEERRRLEEERRRAEAERQRELEELRRQREEAQRRREEEERRLAELAERRAREEAERRAREEADRRRLLEEREAAEMRRATLQDEYVETIRNLVSRNWIRPPTTNPGVRCAVRVIQIPGGEIIDSSIASPCNADEATRRSILAAVNRTAELPYRGYESVFQREIEFIFRYDG